MIQLPPPALPSLRSLLESLSSPRLARIAQQWKVAPQPAAVYRAIVGDPSRFSTLMQRILSSAAHPDLVVDMVQDYNLPVTLHPEDRSTRQLMASWGLIFPYPSDWPGAPTGRAAQWTWVMPVEVALLSAQVVPIYRVSLPLLLAQQPDARIQEIALHSGLDKQPGEERLEQILRLSAHLCDLDLLIDILEEPDWFDHLFTLQIVLEWHGACYPHELFSFAWGEENLVPFAAREQQHSERQIHQALQDLGLLFTHRPPEDPRHPLTEEERAQQDLLVIPEELRPRIWYITRGFQERTLANWLQECGGWDSDRASAPHQLPMEPLDQLKALACLLETRPIHLDQDRGLRPEDRDHLASLSPPELRHSWQPLIQLGLLTEVLHQPDQGGPLSTGPGANRTLDDDAPAWAQLLLRRWVEGSGPDALDQAQNQAMGLHQLWLEQACDQLSRRRQREHLEDWWCHLTEPPEPTQSPLHPDGRMPRRTQRSIPTWLQARGLEGELETWCGFPRPPGEEGNLGQEFQVVEGIVTFFRLLLLDLLSGLPVGQRLNLEALASALQDTASLSVHLHLACLFFDASGQLMIPVRPPSYLAERVSDEVFLDFALHLLEDLLLPAGLATRVPGQPESFQLWSDRFLVPTPPWAAERGRMDALAGVLELEREAVSRRRPSPPWLRAVRATTQGEGESERRFWLGRPWQDLKQAINGRHITGLRGAYLEVEKPK